MIEILVALIALTAIPALLVKYLGYRYDSYLSTVASMTTTIGCVGLVIYSIVSIPYIAAGYKAEIINSTYGTHYTQAQVFYASDVLEEVRELKRKRIELKIE